MDSVRTLIIGAGVTGLATAAALSERGDDDYLVLEADREIGGWCKTVKKEGFVWDYSGHFFHFRHPEIERWLATGCRASAFASSRRRTSSPTRAARHVIDFPFQKNIHQLPQDEFIDCLHDLYFARSSDVKRDAAAGAARPSNFKEMLAARFGQGHLREIPLSLQREALRLRPRDARHGRDGPLLPVTRT